MQVLWCLNDMCRQHGNSSTVVCTTWRFTTAGGAWTPTLAGAGVYTYTVLATAPCTVNATATVTVTAQAQPNAGTNGTLTICAGSTVTPAQLFAQLGGTPDAGGAWTPALVGAGVYTYTVTATAPCTINATAR